jgi:5-methylcytosine-specific restriction endonuclease McrA
MTEHCTNCGSPVDHTEEHHVDEQRGNNDPDNLTPRCRRCHHDRAHDNPRAVDDQTTQRYGPQRPATGPPSPF